MVTLSRSGEVQGDEAPLASWMLGKSTGLAPPDSSCIPTKQKKPGEKAGLFFVVEMPGIEPGSLGEELVILRAQFGLAFLCPDVHPNEMSTGTVTV